MFKVAALPRPFDEPCQIGLALRLALFPDQRADMLDDAVRSRPDRQRRPDERGELEPAPYRFLPTAQQCDNPERGQMAENRERQ